MVCQPGQLSLLDADSGSDIRGGGQEWQAQSGKFFRFARIIDQTLGNAFAQKRQGLMPPLGSIGLLPRLLLDTRLAAGGPLGPDPLDALASDLLEQPGNVARLGDLRLDGGKVGLDRCLTTSSPD